MLNNSSAKSFLPAASLMHKPISTQDGLRARVDGRIGCGIGSDESVDIRLTDSMVDLIEGGFDVAIRNAAP